MCLVWKWCIVLVKPGGDEWKSQRHCRRENSGHWVPPYYWSNRVGWLKISWVKYSEKLSPRKKQALGLPMHCMCLVWVYWWCRLIGPTGWGWVKISWVKISNTQRNCPREKAGTGSPHALHGSGLGVLVMYNIGPYKRLKEKAPQEKENTVTPPMHCMCLVWVYWGYWEAVLS